MSSPQDDVYIAGIQNLQQANLNMIANLKPENLFGEVIKDASIAAHRYAVSITHVWHIKGGALKASHRMKVDGLQGEIFIDDKTVNPRGQMPHVYGVFEHRRGGEHAFYARTVEEKGEDILKKAVRTLSNGLEKRAV